MVTCSDDLVTALHFVTKHSQLDKPPACDNNITGSIPTEPGKLQKLKILDLSNNFFSGQIPTSLSHLKSLQYLGLNNNSLSGPIPASFANVTQLAFLDMSFTNLSGPVPRFPARAFNIVGKPLICAAGMKKDCFGTALMPLSFALNNSQNSEPASSLGCIFFLIVGFGFLLWWRQKHNQQMFLDANAKSALDWGTRKRIAIGAARGLFYLHEQCDPKIIHGDVKAANILPDDYFEAVVGDFGLAKLLDHHDSHVTTAVRGTVGNIAPEYLSTGQSSERTDVFGYYF